MVRAFNTTQSNVTAQGLPKGVFGASIATPELGYVGEVNKVHVQLVQDLLDQDIIPILTSLGQDTNGQGKQ